MCFQLFVRGALVRNASTIIILAIVAQTPEQTVMERHEVY